MLFCRNLRAVMTDGAADRSSKHGVTASNMARYAAHRGPFKTPGCCRRRCHETKRRHGSDLNSSEHC